MGENKKIIIGSVVAGAIVLLGGAAAYASNTTQLTQVIDTGTLTSDIVTSGGTPQNTPTLTLDQVTASGSTQTTSATYPSGTDQVFINNPGAASTSWNLSIAATAGPTAKWARSGGGADFDFNDPAGSGATNGQMTVDASNATLSVTAPNTSTGISVNPTAEAFEEGVLDGITLVSATGSFQSVWQGYLTGVEISQKIPAGQAAGTYNISLTQTIMGS